MRKSEQAALARHQLDEKLQVADFRGLAHPPTHGWIRAIRDALGMTSRQLAARMGISQSAVAKLERSEVEGTIRLSSLRRAAEALECNLVYGLLPRTSLEEIIRRRARELAADDLHGVNQSMRLENQAVTNEQLANRLEEYASRLITEGRLWDEVPQLADQ